MDIRPLTLTDDPTGTMKALEAAIDALAHRDDAKPAVKRLMWLYWRFNDLAVDADADAARACRIARQDRASAEIIPMLPRITTPIRQISPDLGGAV